MCINFCNEKIQAMFNTRIFESEIARLVEEGIPVGGIAYESCTESLSLIEVGVCCAVLCCTVLCCVGLSCAVLCCIVLYICIVLYCILLYGVILHSKVYVCIV
jgi:hypothetical protein